MYLSHSDNAQAHQHAIEHAHDTGRIVLDTAEKLTALGLRYGRAKLDQRARHAEELTATDDGQPLPAARWFGESQALAAAAGEELLRTMVQGNQALLAASQAQLRALDAMLMRGVERDERDAPQGMEYAFSLFKHAIRHTEDALENLGTVIATSARSVEQHAEQVLGAIVPPGSPAAAATTAATTSAAETAAKGSRRKAD